MHSFGTEFNNSLSLCDTLFIVRGGAGDGANFPKNELVAQRRM